MVVFRLCCDEPVDVSGEAESAGFGTVGLSQDLQDRTPK